MAIVEVPVDAGKVRRNIALVNLVESKKESKGYEYVATRVYDPNTDTISDVALRTKGQPKDMPKHELGWATWRELPMLDIETKQLVGKNKDKYCTLVSIRVYRLAAEPTLKWEFTWGWLALPNVPVSGCACTGKHKQPARVLGYTFMDVNGDKRYMTVSELRKEDIFQHAHSVSLFEDGAVRMRKIMVGPRAIRIYVPKLELDDVDTTLEDEEVAQAKLFKTLVGGWYTMGIGGVIQVDEEAIKSQQLEELEIPESILHIPSCTFAHLDTVRRVKLPETTQTIGYRTFTYLENLEEINIPRQVKELNLAFRGCMKLKRLDVSGVERFIDFGVLAVEHLIVPDSPQELTYAGNITIDVLEFRNTTNARKRVLKVPAKKSRLVLSVSKWEAGRIETNGPVVLGNYGVDVMCVDASALEPNIVGIAPNCSFYKVDAEENRQQWVLGPATEFVYTAEPTYRFTPDACAANKLRAAVVSKQISTVLPESVEILQGVLSASMCTVSYPNVIYATLGLYSTLDVPSETPETPSLRWLLSSKKLYTESQIKQLEKKLTPKLPEICKRTQEALKLNLESADTLKMVRRGLLCGCAEYSNALAPLLKEYGMIYVGDYGAALRGEH